MYGSKRFLPRSMVVYTAPARRQTLRAKRAWTRSDQKPARRNPHGKRRSRSRNLGDDSILLWLIIFGDKVTIMNERCISNEQTNDHELHLSKSLHDSCAHILTLFHHLAHFMHSISCFLTPQ
ncbi:uncharacterized protein CIMG_12890 [Coccidioides immitis RS]|uniref:Uncharacterized protein n=1 Tax=Coccidioides immitis (strain RS) TaxID=246410 RepID=J3KGM1_COCIM|nr:uncharacterized protein CIMG_12890 [Coccidioides immitis RS]EAS34904.3 hypothetical protein CIMG_12890 [Coccidioides immitis RS]